MVSSPPESVKTSHCDPWSKVLSPSVFPSLSALYDGPYFFLDPNSALPGRTLHSPEKFLETPRIPGPTLIIKPDSLGCGNSLKSGPNQSGGHPVGYLISPG